MTELRNIKTPVLATTGSQDGDYKVALTANTATAIPSGTVPSYDYKLLLSNRSSTEMVHGITSSIVSGGAIDIGTTLDSTNGKASVSLQSGNSIYVACGSAETINYSIYSIKEAV